MINYFIHKLLGYIDFSIIAELPGSLYNIKDIFKFWMKIYYLNWMYQQINFLFTKSGIHFITTKKILCQYSYRQYYVT